MQRSVTEKMYDACRYQVIHESTYYCPELNKYIPTEGFNLNACLKVSDNPDNNEIKNAIIQRRSCRTFLGKEISIENIKKLLFYGYGLKSEMGSFTVPLAGGLDLMHLTAVIRSEDCWKVHFWDPIGYQLKQTNYTIDKPNRLFFSKNTYFDHASLIIMISANLNILSKRYGSRAYKFSCIQAGHIAQNLLLLSTQQHYSSLVLGAIKEDEIIHLCHFKEEKPLYAVILG